MQESKALISTTAKPTSLHDKIAQRAKELWTEYGQPADRDVGIWLEAEQSVHAAAQARHGESSPPAPSAGLPPTEPARSSKRSTTQTSGRAVLAASSDSAVKAALRAKKAPGKI